MRLILGAIGSCMVPVMNTLVLWFAFQFVYGILGVNLFAGKFHSCSVSIAGEAENIAPEHVFGKIDCVGSTVAPDGAISEPSWAKFGGQWYNFDHIGIAMVSLFEVASLEGWVDVMNAAMDVTHLDQQPAENASWYNCLYFVTFICLGTFIVINLLVGVFVDSFYQAKGIGLLTDEQRKWYDLRNLIVSKHPKRIEGAHCPYCLSYAHDL